MLRFPNYLDKPSRSGLPIEPLGHASDEEQRASDHAEKEEPAEVALEQLRPPGFEVGRESPGSVQFVELISELWDYNVLERVLF